MEVLADHQDIFLCEPRDGEPNCLRWMGDGQETSLVLLKQLEEEERTRTHLADKDFLSV